MKTDKPSRRKKPSAAGIVCSEWAALPTAAGPWRIFAFRERAERRSANAHVALVCGDIAGKARIPVRIHSECLTGDAFGSKKCDCGPQLKLAMRLIRRIGRGMVIYLRQEGRGIGIFDKVRAYHLQDQGADTVEANRLLGLPVDARDYRAAADLLRLLDIRSVRLLTNNPDKLKSLRRAGIRVSERLPLITRPTKENRGYLRTKKSRLRHAL